MRKYVCPVAMEEGTKERFGETQTRQLKYLQKGCLYARGGAQLGVKYE